MQQVLRGLPVLLVGLLILACSKQEQAQQQTATPAPATTPQQEAAAVEPDHIEVQHILIAFQGSIPGKNITRSQAEAQQLAFEVLALAQQEASFDDLVRQYTDDAFPGRYKMSNTGAAPGPGEYPRQGMVAAFGNVGFKLAVGEVGMAPYDPGTSPYGWHIIKRLN